VARAVLLVPVMRTPLLHAVTSTLLSIGCAASGQVQYRAQVTPPELVYINSDVQVIADYGEPIWTTTTGGTTAGSGIARRAIRAAGFASRWSRSRSVASSARRRTSTIVVTRARTEIVDR